MIVTMAGAAGSAWATFAAHLGWPPGPVQGWGGEAVGYGDVGLGDGGCEGGDVARGCCAKLQLGT